MIVIPRQRRARHVEEAASSSFGVRRLYRDGASLAVSSLLTAFVGMAFWAVAARRIPADKLGVQTAILSIITAPGIVIGSGIGDAFTALLPSFSSDRGWVVRHGYRLVLFSGALLGVVAGVVAVTVLPQVRDSWNVAALVACGTLIWALFTVQDSALTSMGRARWLPFENGSVSLAKLSLLPVLAAASLSFPLVVATLIPSLIAVLVLAPRVHAMAKARSADVPEHGLLRTGDVNALALRTTSSVALTLGALTFLPFVVTAVAGPRQGAVFAVCLNITQSLDFVTSALGVSLVVHASARQEDAVRMAAGVLKRTVLIVGCASAALLILSPRALAALGPDYRRLHGIATIGILCFGSLCRTVFVVWAALQRSRRNLRPVLILNAVAATVLYGTLPALGSRWGAPGAAVALALAQLVLSAGSGAHLLLNVKKPAMHRAQQPAPLHALTVPAIGGNE